MKDKDFEYTDEEKKIIERAKEYTSVISPPSGILQKLIDKQKELEQEVLQKRKWSEPDCYYCGSSIGNSFDRTYIVNEMTNNDGISIEKHNICSKCLDKIWNVLYE